MNETFYLCNMEVIRNGAVPKGTALVATVGSFDGVHAGHRFLIRALCEAGKERSLPTAVITFPHHPREVVRQAGYRLELLNSFEEKVALLSQTGVDYCIVLDFTPELAQLPADAFIGKVLADKLHVRTLLTGYDHHFGYNRTDGSAQYVEYGRRCGVEVLSVDYYGVGDTVVCSSGIRRLIADGRVDDAARLLTYEYRLHGKVTEGFHMGRKLGFPTANLCIDEPYKLLPQAGVYAVYADVEGKRFMGMLYIGDRPTFGATGDVSVEVHLLDFSGNLYGKEMTLSLVIFMRHGRKFANTAELAAHLAIDQLKVRQLLEDPKTTAP
ncbi:MAG: riboflavin biosynthesis protein RibF [Tannerellaceae bacterium]|jgi:riboflavin kinase/FMN adenylyltransferase|nr:riboflavin biosynthesis protein RibF [Tannerellaceae bacterium]